ncbi:MAG: hypothetical protein GPI99_17050 [Microcystis aeruginosa W13-15]|nr:hypothetical protein [Microcystis aeruginosa W13-15]
MHKINFVRILGKIDSTLHSNNIVKFYNDIFRNSREKIAYYDTKTLVSMIIKSKSGYDDLSRNPEMLSILEALELPKIYELDNITALTSYVASHNEIVSIFSNLELNKFLSLHRLINSYSATIGKLLFDSQISLNYVQSISNGIIYFEWLNQEIIVNYLSKILLDFDEILSIINILYEEEEDFEPSSLISIESGSPIKFGLKMAKKAASAFSNTVHELWRYAVDHKNFKDGLNDEAIHKKLDLIERISILEKEKKISKEDASNFKERLVKKTSELLTYGVVTEEISLSEKTVTGKSLTLEKAKLFIENSDQKNP